MQVGLRLRGLEWPAGPAPVAVARSPALKAIDHQ